MARGFKFILESGRIIYVCADSRKEAIEAFCKEHGCDKDFVKKHCVVKTEGVLKNAEHW